jgi:pyruvate formate lyase activating enzyme
MISKVGYINSIEPLGTFDGPGVRFVVFFQGCLVGCKYCHNRDTWNIRKGKTMTADEIVAIYLSYRNFYSSGGVTISGGEPLQQIDFLIDLLREFKKIGVHTTVDTSGYLFSRQDTEKYEELASLTELFFLSIKSFKDNDPLIIPNISANPLDFLLFLEQKNRPVILRYVIIPLLTDDYNSLIMLSALQLKHNNVIKIQLLPYNKMGIMKWKLESDEYTLSEISQASSTDVERAYKIIKSKK